MKVVCEGLSEQMQMQMECPVGTQHSEIKARALLLLSALLFTGYLGNIVMGVLNLHFKTELFHLGNVWEFLMLFGAAAGFIIFVLLNESHDS